MTFFVIPLWKEWDGLLPQCSVDLSHLQTCSCLRGTSQSMAVTFSGGEGQPGVWCFLLDGCFYVLSSVPVWRWTVKIPPCVVVNGFCQACCWILQPRFALDCYWSWSCCLPQLCCPSHSKCFFLWEFALMEGRLFFSPPSKNWLCSCSFSILEKKEGKKCDENTRSLIPILSIVGQISSLGMQVQDGDFNYWWPCHLRRWIGLYLLPWQMVISVFWLSLCVSSWEQNSHFSFRVQPFSLVAAVAFQQALPW